MGHLLMCLLFKARILSIFLNLILSRSSVFVSGWLVPCSCSLTQGHSDMPEERVKPWDTWSLTAQEKQGNHRGWGGGRQWW